MAKRQWKNVLVPFEMFEMATERALVFKFRSGAYADYSFVRPNKTVRSDRDGFKGFMLGYSIEQSFDANGDVVGETAETLVIRQTGKDDDGNWVTFAEEELTMDMLESLL